jgi:putative tricarboxylic transport membrane protein
MTRGLTDRIAGAILLALAIWYWREAAEYRVMFGDPAGPSLFPRVVAVPMGLFALIILLRPDPNPEWPGLPAALRQLAALVVLFGFPLLIKPLGFPAATFLAVVPLGLILGGSLLQTVLSGLGLAAGLFWLFDRVFGLPLPPGPLFG